MSTIRLTSHWLWALAHDRYCRAYWQQVAESEWWLGVLQTLAQPKARRREG